MIQKLEESDFPAMGQKLKIFFAFALQICYREFHGNVRGVPGGSEEMLTIRDVLGTDNRESTITESGAVKNTIPRSCGDWTYREGITKMNSAIPSRFI